MSKTPETDAARLPIVVRLDEKTNTMIYAVPDQVAEALELERNKLREEVEDLKVRYRSAMMDRDSYRFQAEQKYAMRRELEELLGIDNGAPGDEQFKKGLKALKEVVRKAKLYDKKN